MPDLSPRLDELARAGLARRRRTVESADGPHLLVDGHRYLAFCSNDYLGLAHHPALIEAACRGAERYGVGAGASALISGHTEAHEALEARLARFVRLPRALPFGAGYLANLGLVAALAGRGGTVFSDELNHACLVDGARLSRAEVQVYPHLDVAALGRLLESCTTAEKLVATDEALIEWLVQRARPYVFPPASPPLLACALMASLELIEQEESRRNHLRALVGRLRQRLEDLPWRLRASATPVQPLIVGDNRAALDLAEGLRSRGIWVPAIRPPTVPAGTARLRIALSAAHSVEHVDELAAALHELAKSR